MIAKSEFEANINSLNEAKRALSRLEGTAVYEWFSILYMHVYMCICVYTHKDINLYYTYICLYIYICVYMYIYMYIYVHVYI